MCPTQWPEQNVSKPSGAGRGKLGVVGVFCDGIGL